MRYGWRAAGVASGLALAVCLPAVALAHDGRLHGPDDLAKAWSWDPAVIVGLIVVAATYVRGVRVLWRRAGAGRGVRYRQAAAFAAGVAMLALALISPLDAVAHTLFAAHMVQHTLLVAAGAPLLALGTPLVAMTWALPKRWRTEQAWRRSLPVRAAVALCGRLARPLAALALHTLALWVWHAPPLYQAALDHPLVHAAEHASFLATGVLFWWTLVHAGARGRNGYAVGVLITFAAAVQSTVLGALLTFSPRPWYPAYAADPAGAALWGLTPLEDQQLAGLIMWVPASMVYLAAALALMAAWLAAAEHDARRRDEPSSIKPKTGQVRVRLWPN